MSYIVYTDTACDIRANVLADWQVKYLNLTFQYWKTIFFQDLA